MRVNVVTHLGKVHPNIGRASKGLTHALTQQVVKDSNFYAPEDLGYAGGLKGSAITTSDFNGGKVIWQKVYARRLYYGVTFNFSKDKNPRAQAMWFDKAKAVHFSEWMSLVDSGIKKGL